MLVLGGMSLWNIQSNYRSSYLDIRLLVRYTHWPAQSDGHVTVYCKSAPKGSFL